MALMLPDAQHGRLPDLAISQDHAIDNDYGFHPNNRLSPDPIRP
jgi:hypothetical protein